MPKTDESLPVMALSAPLFSEQRRGSSRIENLLAVQREVTLILAEAESLRSAAPRILGELCRHLGWEWGAFWRLQGRRSELVCREVYRGESFDPIHFEALSRDARIRPGAEVVGRVWEEGGPREVADFGAQPLDGAWGSRYAAGVAEGLRSAILFPITSGRNTIGVLELASLVPHDPDENFIQLLVSVCSQIGQFVERKRAFDEVARHGREVERQKAFVDRLMCMVPAGIAYVDRSLVVRWANPQLARMLRRPGGSIVNRPMQDILLDRRIRRMVQRVLQRGGTQRLMGYGPAWASETGSFFDVVVSTVGGFDAPGDGLLVFLLDASERTRADRFREQQLAEVAKVDRLKTDFLNATSHELRTPLSIILGYAEFLEDQIGGPLTDQQSDFVAAIAQAGKALRFLVDDMLDFARLEAGHFVLERRTADMRSIIRGVVQHTEGLAAYHEVQVSLELPDEPARVEMDSFRIGRVIRNVVSNAIKFNKPGGEVVISLSATGRSIRVEVRDTGIGIPEPHRGRIFEKFYQVDASATRQHGGAGLGLSVAKALVLAHRGKMGFSSEDGSGSTFWFTLPRWGRVQGSGPLELPD